MAPAFANPKTNWIRPAKATLNKNASKDPRLRIAAATMVVSPAAGPLTLTDEPLNEPTTIPPIIPANNPEKSGAPEAKAIPKHRGRATKNTTIDDRRSEDQKFRKFINTIKM